MAEVAVVEAVPVEAVVAPEAGATVVAAGCPTASSRKSVISVRTFRVPALAPAAVEAALR